MQTKVQHYYLEAFCMPPKSDSPLPVESNQASDQHLSKPSVQSHYVEAFCLPPKWVPCPLTPVQANHHSKARERRSRNLEPPPAPAKELLSEQVIVQFSRLDLSKQCDFCQLSLSKQHLTSRCSLAECRKTFNVCEPCALQQDGSCFRHSPVAIVN